MPQLAVLAAPPGVQHSIIGYAGGVIVPAGDLQEGSAGATGGGMRHLHHWLEFESCHNAWHFGILFCTVPELAVGAPAVAEHLALLCTTDNWSAARERERGCDTRQ